MIYRDLQLLCHLSDFLLLGSGALVCSDSVRPELFVNFFQLLQVVIDLVIWELHMA